MAFRFETLEIWQMAKEYAMKVYAVTAKFPRHEDYGLKSQGESGIELDRTYYRGGYGQE